MKAVLVLAITLALGLMWAGWEIRTARMESSTLRAELERSRTSAARVADSATTTTTRSSAPKPELPSGEAGAASSRKPSTPAPSSSVKPEILPDGAIRLGNGSLLSPAETEALAVASRKAVPVGGITHPEKPGEPDLTIPVSEGTALISKDKPVTSSETAPSIGDMVLVTDGDKDGADGSFVELGPGPQWVQIDLGAENNISAVIVWHFLKQARVYKDVLIEVGSDADMAKPTVLFNNDDDNSTKKGTGKDFSYVETQDGRIIDGKGTKARYVRCWSDGNNLDDLNHYVEVEVWGNPAK